MTDQQNLILAIVLSILVIVAFQYFYDIPRREQLEQQRAAQEAAREAERPAASAEAPAVPGLPAADVPAPPGAAPRPVAEALEGRRAALGKSPRIAIVSPRLSGSFSLAGARLDDLTLTDYRETPDADSPQITLLSPVGATGAYFAQFGMVSADAAVPVPGSDTEWRADGDALAPGDPVTLTWDNGQGLRFSRVIALDGDYMFTITQRVQNTAANEVTLYPYGLISRTGTPPTLGFYILHEGLTGVFNETLQEIKYDKLQEDGPREVDSTGGWLGITDKYWLVALVPDQSEPFKGRFIHNLRDGNDKYQVDFQRGALTVPPGGRVEVTSRLFAGAKEVKAINRYHEEVGIARFDLAIDWGWYPFLTKPIFYAIDKFNQWIGNFGLAILLLTVLIKLLFFPLANKSYKSMATMKKLNPKMVELRERHKDDKQKLQQEMMALYKAEGANPLSGCLPVVVQIPVFFALYKVLFVTIEMRHAPFFGWIQDLSAPDPTSLFNLFGLIPWAPPAIFILGVWPLAMGLTMLLQMRLNPQPVDPTQAKVMMAMPVVFTFLFARFPAGLVIYWTWNNVLSIAQQWIIMKRMGAPT